jgi:hypothetical protein
MLIFIRFALSPVWEPVWPGKLLSLSLIEKPGNEIK